MHPGKKYMTFGMRWRTLLPLALLTLLVACSGPMTRQDVVGMRRVAVVSNLGQQLHLLSVGTTVITNRLSSIPVDTWAIDRLVLNHAQDQVRAVSGAAVEPLDWTGLPTRTLPESGLTGPQLAPLLDRAQKQGFDTLVVIEGDDNQTFARMRAGYGLYVHYFLGSGSTCVYVSMRATVYNVASRQRLAGDIGATYPCLRGSEGKYPIKAEWRDYSESERSDIRRDVEYAVMLFTRSLLGRLLPSR